MPPDPARVAETREWLEKTVLDLRGARIDLEATPPLLEDTLFHCQQAVEKSLKAFLAWHDRPFRKTHSLEELGAACEAIDATLRSVVDPAVPAVSETCLCGKVCYRATEPFLDMLHCHCTDCRKAHGAVFATAIGVPRDRFAIVAGDDALASFTTPSGTRRSFCRRCGSKIAVENDAWDALYVPAGTIDTPLPHRPQLHMYVRSKVTWFDIEDGLPQFDTVPDDDYRDKVPPLRR